MLSFDEFSKAVKNNIISRSDNIEVDSGVAEKNNGVKKPYISIKGKNDIFGVNQYLDEAYKSYQSGIDINKICDKMYESYIHKDSIFDNLKIRPENITDYDFIKDHAVLRVVNSEKNYNMLIASPYKQLKGFDDLVVVGRLELESSEEGNASVLITEKMLDEAGMSAKEMFDYAQKNTEQMHPVNIETMSAMLSRLTGAPEFLFEDTPPIFVVTNADYMNGATVLAYDGIFDQIKGVVKDDFYIIPSSIHETLIFPKTMARELDGGEATINATVREVNGSVISPEEFLSDNIYSYNSNTRAVSTIINEASLSKGQIFEDDEMRDMNEGYQAY